jgi:hypothetical protein
VFQIIKVLENTTEEAGLEPALFRCQRAMPYRLGDSSINIAAFVYFDVGSINFYYPNSFNSFLILVLDNFMPVAVSKMLCTVPGFMSFP